MNVSVDVNSSDSDLSSSGTNTPQRQSVSDNENSTKSTAGSTEDTEANHSDDSGVGVPKAEAAQSSVSDVADSPGQDKTSEPPADEAKAAPVPAPRVSFCSTEQCALLPAKHQQDSEEEPDADGSGELSSSHNPPGFLYKVHISTLLQKCDNITGTCSTEPTRLKCTRFYVITTTS